MSKPRSPSMVGAGHEPWSEAEEQCLRDCVARYGRSWTMIQWKMYTLADAIGAPRRSKSAYDRHWVRMNGKPRK